MQCKPLLFAKIFNTGNFSTTQIIKRISVMYEVSVQDLSFLHTDVCQKTAVSLEQPLQNEIFDPAFPKNFVRQE